ncbi:hypothetical protein KIH87_05635 [Paraneptunicella aestuarii]|uniref:hypothetical protein n=1 Tax=Paraneptunicella aestuarii TaxID=2831148 RepID=UPI001E53B78D|nr:hypothetical protein [Paraneptunicella aestuarii]UAA39836.1 hypothetical protein KIH87_05635 [Paraneptunicella aestuarii]
MYSFLRRHADEYQHLKRRFRLRRHADEYQHLKRQFRLRRHADEGQYILSLRSNSNTQASEMFNIHQKP